MQTQKPTGQLATDQHEPPPPPAPNGSLMNSVKCDGRHRVKQGVTYAEVTRPPPHSLTRGISLALGAKLQKWVDPSPLTVHVRLPPRSQLPKNPKDRAAVCGRLAAVRLNVGRSEGDRLPRGRTDKSRVFSRWGLGAHRGLSLLLRQVHPHPCLTTHRVPFQVGYGGQTFVCKDHILYVCILSISSGTETWSRPNCRFPPHGLIVTLITARPWLFAQGRMFSPPESVGTRRHIDRPW